MSCINSPGRYGAVTKTLVRFCSGCTNKAKWLNDDVCMNLLQTSFSLWTQIISWRFLKWCGQANIIECWSNTYSWVTLSRPDASMRNAAGLWCPRGVLTEGMLLHCCASSYSLFPLWKAKSSRRIVDTCTKWEEYASEEVKLGEANVIGTIAKVRKIIFNGKPSLPTSLNRHSLINMNWSESFKTTSFWLWL